MFDYEIFLTSMLVGRPRARSSRYHGVGREPAAGIEGSIDENLVRHRFDSAKAMEFTTSAQGPDRPL